MFSTQWWQYLPSTLLCCIVHTPSCQNVHVLMLMAERPGDLNSHVYFTLSALAFGLKPMLELYGRINVYKCRERRFSLAWNKSFPFGTNYDRGAHSKLHVSPRVVNPLTAGVAYIRVFIFYWYIKYQILKMLKIKCDINQQDLKRVDLHFLKSE